MRVGVAAAVLFLALAGNSGSARASHGGIFIPPIEIDLGHAVAGAPEGGQIEMTQVLVGLSWASLYPKATPVDFGVGVVILDGPADETTAAARTVGAVEEDDSVVGTYVHFAVRGAHGQHWRTWIGGRGEMIDYGHVSGAGAVARGAVEIWTGGAGGGSNAFYMGTVALSAWAETGVREQPYGGAASFVAAGLGMRMPLVVAGN